MKFLNRIEEIDPRCYEECAEKGKVERIDYQTTKYDGSPMDKYAFVYTPYGYDPEKEYEILYLIHGGAENAEKYLFQGGEENPLKRAVDNLIAEKTIKPILIVTPSEYPHNDKAYPMQDSAIFCEYFQNELVNDLLPAVESKYHTYAGFDTSAEKLTQAREKRHIMGWSMGCMTTWYTFLKRISYFSKFGMLSCFCAIHGQDPTKEWADQTAQTIVESIQKQGFTKKDYDVYIITGSLDIVYEKCALQSTALFAYPEYFDFYSNEQNATYLIWPQGEHHTQWRLQYTINAIKQFYLL